MIKFNLKSSAWSQLDVIWSYEQKSKMMSSEIWLHQATPNLMGVVKFETININPSWWAKYQNSCRLFDEYSKFECISINPTWWAQSFTVKIWKHQNKSSLMIKISLNSSVWSQFEKMGNYEHKSKLMSSKTCTV